MVNPIKKLIIVFICLSLVACARSPKVIDAESLSISIAQEIANIRSTLDDETGRSIDDNYQILVTNVSVDGNKENFISQNQDKIITQLRAQKASYSGVSLDEEMTNLLKYERAYQAAAKVAQAVDEIMKTILQLV